MMKKEQYNDNTQLPYSKKAITDMYNSAHSTSFQPNALKFVRHGFNKETAIGVLGFGPQQFAIINYVLWSDTSVVKVLWGVSDIIVTNLSKTNNWNGVMFDSYTQQQGESQIYYYLLEFV